jgi:acetate kinase
MEQVINTFQKEQYLDKSDKIITIHLGNGCSMAIKDGISIDHSLGFAPSNGLIMGKKRRYRPFYFLYGQYAGIFFEAVNNLLLKERKLTYWF